mmetsp:Transcript_11222/g.35634  ORF Transcript_11222/g.35634 Transcript_11222/m.35634 type:complete len:452 (-) Transcript_11222:48-1403(-)
MASSGSIHVSSLALCQAASLAAAALPHSTTGLLLGITDPKTGTTTVSRVIPTVSSSSTSATLAGATTKDEETGDGQAYFDQYQDVLDCMQEVGGDSIIVGFVACEGAAGAGPAVHEYKRGGVKAGCAWVASLADAAKKHWSAQPDPPILLIWDPTARVTGASPPLRGYVITGEPGMELPMQRVPVYIDAGNLATAAVLAARTAPISQASLTSCMSTTGVSVSLLKVANEPTKKTEGVSAEALAAAAASTGPIHQHPNTKKKVKALAAAKEAEQAAQKEAARKEAAKQKEAEAKASEAEAPVVTVVDELSLGAAALSIAPLVDEAWLDVSPAGSGAPAALAKLRDAADAAVAESARAAQLARARTRRAAAEEAWRARRAAENEQRKAQGQSILATEPPESALPPAVPDSAQAHVELAQVAVELAAASAADAAVAGLVKLTLSRALLTREPLR